VSSFQPPFIPSHFLTAFIAHEVAEKLKLEIGSHIFRWQTTELSVSVSIGLATAPAPGIQEGSHLVEAADRALYQAKRAGRNAVVVLARTKPSLMRRKLSSPSYHSSKLLQSLPASPNSRKCDSAFHFAITMEHHFAGREEAGYDSKLTRRLVCPFEILNWQLIRT